MFTKAGICIFVNLSVQITVLCIRCMYDPMRLSLVFSCTKITKYSLSDKLHTIIRPQQPLLTYIEFRAIHCFGN
jgi:hypothetical protein